MLLSRQALQRVLGALWLIDGLLQLQPQMFTMNMVNGVMKPMLAGQPGFLEPSLQFIVTQTTLHLIEVNLLIAIVQILLGLGFLLLLDRRVKELVIASLVVSVLIWYCCEAFGMILTGMATDFNSGLLLVVMALACWPHAWHVQTARTRYVRQVREEKQVEGSGSAQRASCSATPALLIG